MKNINSAPRFMVYALAQAIRHPRTPIRYNYCPKCRKRLPPNEEKCPVCQRKIRENPERRELSPIPWYGAVLVIALGVACWVVGSIIPVPGLSEAGRALVYIPLGSLFGMSLRD